MSNLPIDVIPNTTPPRFRWKQRVTTPIGDKTVEHEGVLPPSLEQAVGALVMVAKRLTSEVVLAKAENIVLKNALEVQQPSVPVSAPVVAKKGK